MMEFEDEDREEEEEEDEDDDDETTTTTTTTTTLLTPSYKLPSDKKQHSTVARYKECLKNHAVTIGGHALDGCGEFMPAGPQNSLDSLKCAACNCHRNFHRREHLLLDPTNNNNNNHHHHQQQQLTVYTPRPPGPPPHVYQFYPYSRTTPNTPPSRALALPSPTEDHVTAGLGMGLMTMTMTSSSGRKRHRTKFSQEQKEKMLELAEGLGWRIQKQDETVVKHFCDETGVERHVLKVWMHNNKHTLGKKLLPSSSDPSNLDVVM